MKKIQLLLSLIFLLFGSQVFAVSSFDAFDKKAAKINMTEHLMTCESSIYGDIQVSKRGDTIRYHIEPPKKIIESDIWGKRYIFEGQLWKGLVDFNKKRYYPFLDDPGRFDKCW